MGFISFVLIVVGAGLMVWAGTNGSKYDNFLMVTAMIWMVVGIFAGLFEVFT
jgi:hypothetical protein